MNLCGKEIKMGNKINRTCPVCNVVYEADEQRLKHGRQITCSKKCSYEFRASKLNNQIECICGTCGKNFYKSPSQIKSKHEKIFCSQKCAYKTRSRVVDKTYVITKTYDKRTASLKAWETRRRNNKPYPEDARNKARINLANNLKNLGKISKFEKKVFSIIKKIGVNAAQSCIARNKNGTFLCIFDIVIPERKIIIECHGTYWHGGRWSWEKINKSQIKNLLHEEKKLELSRKNWL